MKAGDRELEPFGPVARWKHLKRSRSGVDGEGRNMMKTKFESKKEAAVNHQNRYCCRCHCTTKYNVIGTQFTCTQCGVTVNLGERRIERTLIGNPFTSFRIAHA
jgi:hypothetical protein